MSHEHSHAAGEPCTSEGSVSEDDITRHFWGTTLEAQAPEYTLSLERSGACAGCVLTAQPR